LSATVSYVPFLVFIPILGAGLDEGNAYIIVFGTFHFSVSCSKTYLLEITLLTTDPLSHLINTATVTILTITEPVTIVIRDVN
jgi:hypothetical protein